MTLPGPAAIIMAGGRSERMRAGGCAAHKALRTVLDVPLIEWNVRTLLHFGFRSIHVAVSVDEPELIRWVAERGSRLVESMRDVSVATLTTMLENTPLGTIGAARRLPEHVADAVVVNVDNLTDLDLRAFLAAHRASGAAATVASHEQPFQVPYGRLDIEGDRVTGYAEKPVIPVQVSSGTYVLGRRAIEAIPPDARTDVPWLVESLLARGEHVAPYRHAAAWLDVNDESTLAAAERMIRSRAWPDALARLASHA